MSGSLSWRDSPVAHAPARVTASAIYWRYDRMAGCSTHLSLRVAHAHADGATRAPRPAADHRRHALRGTDLRRRPDQDLHLILVTPGGDGETFYRWRIKYGALKEDEPQRVKALEQENSRLNKIVAEQALGYLDAEGSAAGNW